VAHESLCGVCTALTASCVVLLAIALEADAFAALAAAFVFAFGKLVWAGATVASPQTLAGLFIVASLTGSVSFARCGNRRALFAACVCAGLGMATHPVALWVLPAIFVAALLVALGVATACHHFGDRAHVRAIASLRIFPAAFDCRRGPTPRSVSRCPTSRRERPRLGHERSSYVAGISQ
jgi:hypothetical protein